MSNYQNFKLKDVAKIITGKTPSTKNPNFFGGDIPFITPADLKGSDIDEVSTYLTPSGAKEVNLLPVNSILVSCIGTLGKVGITKYKSCSNQQINAICFDESKVFPRYALHFCKTLKKTLESIAPATTIPIVNKSRFSELEISLPSLNEQRRIAAILDKAEALRAKRREAIAKLDQLLQSIFIDIFGDPISNPNKFNFLPISKIISRDTINGAYYPKDKYVDNGGTPMVHMSDAFYDTVSTTGLKQVDISKYEVEKYLIDDSDILIARRSLVYEGAAKPCRPKTNGKDMIFESSFIRVTPDKSIIDTTYLFHYLKNTCVRKNFILKFITKSTISGINQKNLNMIEVMIPDIERQNKFRLIEKKINEKKIILEKQNFIFDKFLKSADSNVKCNTLEFNG